MCIDETSGSAPAQADAARSLPDASGLPTTAHRTPRKPPRMLRTSLVRIFEPADVLGKLREIHGQGYLDHLALSSRSATLPAGGPGDPGASAGGRRPPSGARIAETAAWRPSIREQLGAADDPQACGDHDGRQHDESASAHLGGEEILRSRRLHELLMDREEGWRSSLVATPRMIDALNGVRAMAPQADRLIDVFARAAAMSAITGLPLKAPAILLLGPPGIGKTFACGRIAKALGSTFLPLAMNLTPGFGLLAGLAPGWKGAGPGKIAATLATATNASPVILFDEIDKIVAAGLHDRPLDVLHSLWERENAVGFRDEYFDIAFNASGVISIATANDVARISPSLLDRLLVLELEPPTPEQKRAIARQIYAKAASALIHWIEPALRPDVLDHLARETPRRMTRLMDLALPLAIAAARDAVSLDDIRAAQALLDSAAPHPEPPRRFGFLPQPWTPPT